MEKFLKGDIVQHFKRELLTKEELKQEPLKYLYEIIGVAMHTETGEDLMIYQALYGGKRIFARPYSMFMGKVDKEKYPDVKQEYRLELADTYHNFGKVLEKSIGKWCAYYDNGNIRHIRIEEIGKGGGYFRGRKKNGDRTYVEFKNFIGFCNKPTKACREPKIYEYSIKKYMTLIRINERVTHLAEEYQNNKIGNYEAYEQLSNLWLNKESDSRFPEYFEELVVPEVFKETFEDIFGDF